MSAGRRVVFMGTGLVVNIANSMDITIHVANERGESFESPLGSLRYDATILAVQTKVPTGRRVVMRIVSQPDGELILCGEIPQEIAATGYAWIGPVVFDDIRARFNRTLN